MDYYYLIAYMLYPHRSDIQMMKAKEEIKLLDLLDLFCPLLSLAQ
jgi:hypothetical protein